MAASRATIQVATELCCAASLDGIKYPQMEPGQPGSVLCDEAVAVLSDDVGHLERWSVHRFCSFRERLLLLGLETGIASSGLATAVRCFWERWR
jgi:hypothetical protein